MLVCALGAPDFEKESNVHVFRAEAGISAAPGSWALYEHAGLRVFS